jgi:hypothetical protein
MHVKSYDWLNTADPDPSSATSTTSSSSSDGPCRKLLPLTVAARRLDRLFLLLTPLHCSTDVYDLVLFLRSEAGRTGGGRRLHGAVRHLRAVPDGGREHAPVHRHGALRDPRRPRAPLLHRGGQGLHVLRGITVRTPLA